MIQSEAEHRRERHPERSGEGLRLRRSIREPVVAV
jgi:hypothetical protein